MVYAPSMKVQDASPLKYTAICIVIFSLLDKVTVLCKMFSTL